MNSTGQDVEFMFWWKQNTLFSAKMLEFIGNYLRCHSWRWSRCPPWCPCSPKRPLFHRHCHPLTTLALHTSSWRGNTDYNTIPSFLSRTSVLKKYHYIISHTSRVRYPYRNVRIPLSRVLPQTPRGSLWSLRGPMQPTCNCCGCHHWHLYTPGVSV